MRRHVQLAEIVDELARIKALVAPERDAARAGQIAGDHRLGLFMEIWNQAKNFSSQKGKPLGWMVTLARRRAIDGLRKKQAYARAEERLQNETEQQPDAWAHNATEEEILLSDTRDLIRKVIKGLPPAQQQAIDLAFFRGMSQREIAAKTNTPLGTVKTRLELGLKKIYDGLKELKDEL